MGTGPKAKDAGARDDGVRPQMASEALRGGPLVDKVLPFSGMGGMTMYSVELKGPKDEVRTLHVNPWGQVMPIPRPVAARLKSAFRRVKRS